MPTGDKKLTIVVLEEEEEEEEEEERRRRRRRRKDIDDWEENHGNDNDDDGASGAGIGAGAVPTSEKPSSIESGKQKHVEGLSGISSCLSASTHKARANRATDTFKRRQEMAQHDLDMIST
eukprot:766411-Hanusia_phi.AAC.10